MSAPTAPLLAAWQDRITNPEAHVYVAWDGTTYTDETSRLLKVGGVYSMDPVTRYPGASTVTVIFDNLDRRYSANNFDGPLYPFLQGGGWPVKIEVGYAGTVVRMLTGWATDLSPSGREGTATLRAQDRWGVLRSVKVSASGTVGKRTDEAFVIAAGAAGLSSPAHYTVETGGQRCVTVILGGEPLTDSLAKIAQAEGGRVYCDDYGVLHLLNQSSVDAAANVPLWSIYRSEHAYEIVYKRRDPKAANRVVLLTTQREVQTEAVVAHPFLFMGASEVASDGLVYTAGTESVALIVGLDPYTGEEGKVELTSVASISGHVYNGYDFSTFKPKMDGAAVTMTNSAPPASAAPSNTIYWQASVDGTTMTLRMWSVSAALCIVELQVNGKVWKPYAPVRIAADDANAQAAAGVIVPLEMTNDFLPEKAGPLAKRLLLQRLGRIASVDLPDLDGIPWARPGDVFDVYDDSTTPTEVYRVSVLSHDWSLDPGGQFRSALTTAPVDTILVDPVPHAETYVVAPSGTPVASDPDQGPWTLGPAGHVAILDESDLG